MDFYDSLLSITSTLFLGFSVIMGTAHYIGTRSADKYEQTMQQGRFFAGYLVSGLRRHRHAQIDPYSF